MGIYTDVFIASGKYDPESPPDSEITKQLSVALEVHHDGDIVPLQQLDNLRKKLPNLTFTKSNSNTADIDLMLMVTSTCTLETPPEVTTRVYLLQRGMTFQ